MIDPLSGGVVQFENRAQRNFCVAKPVVTEEVPVAIVEKAKVGVSSQNGDWKNTLESLNNLENEKTQQIQEEMLKELTVLRAMMYKESQEAGQSGTQFQSTGSTNNDEIKAMKKEWKREQEDLVKQNNKLKYRIKHMKQH